MVDMQELCNELNKHLPCKSQEDVDALTRLLQEHIDSLPERHIYWSREIYIDAGFDKDKCMLIMIHSDNVVFMPSEEPVEHPGVVVRYKHEIDQTQSEYAYTSGKCEASRRVIEIITNN